MMNQVKENTSEPNRRPSALKGLLTLVELREEQQIYLGRQKDGYIYMEVYRERQIEQKK